MAMAVNKLELKDWTKGDLEDILLKVRTELDKRINASDDEARAKFLGSASGKKFLKLYKELKELYRNRTFKATLDLKVTIEIPFTTFDDVDIVEEGSGGLSGYFDWQLKGKISGKLSKRQKFLLHMGMLSVLDGMCVDGFALVPEAEAFKEEFVTKLREFNKTNSRYVFTKEELENEI
jgi:hypothetical protein